MAAKAGWMPIGTSATCRLPRYDSSCCSDESLLSDDESKRANGLLEIVYIFVSSAVERSVCDGVNSCGAKKEHVLGADVPRTRGEVASFKTSEMQASLRGLLSRWCLCHQTRYRQGLNEVR